MRRTGSAQPTGIVTALAGSASEVSSITNDVYGAADVYAIYEALPARWEGRATWLANNIIYSKTRQFGTSNEGHQFWAAFSPGTPELLLGRPTASSSYMDGTIGTGNDYVLVFGDFHNFVIADRIGTTIDFIPHLFHTSNNRPSGQGGWFAYFRMGSDSVSDGSFRLLEV